MMDSRRAQIIATFLKLKPELLRAEEAETAINDLVMKGKIDFNTGLDLIETFKNRASTESDDDKKDSIPDQTGSIRFPDKDETVFAKAVLELASDAGKEEFNKLLDKMMKVFETEGERMRSELSETAKDLVEITGADVAVAEKFAKEIKENQYIFVKQL